MVLMDMSFVAGVIIRQRVFFSLAPATATGLGSTMPVRTVTIGRLFRVRTTTTATTTRGTSVSVRGVTPARTASTAAPTAAAGSLFALSKGSPNSERV